jgi:hypothetical protein
MSGKMAPTVDNTAPKGYHTQRPGADRIAGIVRGYAYWDLDMDDRSDRAAFVEAIADRLEAAEKLLAQAIAFVPGGHPLGTEYHAYQLEAMDIESRWGER